MLVSNCCGAPPLTETHENMGKCRKCKEVGFSGFDGLCSVCVEYPPSFSTGRIKW